MRRLLFKAVHPRIHLMLFFKSLMRLNPHYHPGYYRVVFGDSEIYCCQMLYISLEVL